MPDNRGRAAIGYCGNRQVQRFDQCFKRLENTIRQIHCLQVHRRRDQKDTKSGNLSPAILKTLCRCQCDRRCYRYLLGGPPSALFNSPSDTPSCLAAAAKSGLPPPPPPRFAEASHAAPGISETQPYCAVKQPRIAFEPCAPAW